MLYQDSFVSMSEQDITIKWYYFPIGSKTVALSDIERVEARSSSLVNGKWRIWGTGSPRVWYALDLKRPSRSKVFRAKIKGKAVDIGFSAERPDELSNILESKGLLAT